MIHDEHIETMRDNYDDHGAELAAKDAEIERLRDQVTRLSTLVDTERSLHDTEIERLRDKEATAEIIFETNKQQRAEIERLRTELRRTAFEDMKTSGHSTNCWAFGFRHYTCALREIDRLRESCQTRSNALAEAEQLAANKDAEIERLRTAYDQEHQNCFNLTEKVIPNLKDDFKGIVYQLKVAAIANDWDTFDDVVAGVLGYD